MNARPWPMLAVRGQPFDSPEYLFEVKWNGIRALAAGPTNPNRALGFTELNLNLAGFKVSTEDLLRLIGQRIERHSAG